MKHGSRMCLVMLAFAPLTAVRADDAESVQRGEKALLTKCYAPPTMTRRAYDDVW